MYNGPLTKGPLTICALYCIILVHFFCIFHSSTLSMSHLFSCCFMLHSLQVALFCVLHSFGVWLYPCCTFFICSLFKLHFFRVVRCSCCTFFVLPHVALTSCCTFFCVALIWCCTFSVLHFFHIKLFSSFTFLCCSFRVALVSCCTVFMLNFLCVALLHAEPFLVLPYVALC